MPRQGVVLLHFGAGHEAVQLLEGAAHLGPAAEGLVSQLNRPEHPPHEEHRRNQGAQLQPVSCQGQTGADGQDQGTGELGELAGEDADPLLDPAGADGEGGLVGRCRFQPLLPDPFTAAGLDLLEVLDQIEQQRLQP